MPYPFPQYKTAHDDFLKNENIKELTDPLPDGYPLAMGMPFPQVDEWWQKVVRIQVAAAATWCANPDMSSCSSSDDEHEVRSSDSGAESGSEDGEKV